MTPLGGVHQLVTGINGQGKTLYVVAEILRHLAGTKLEQEGLQPVERRLCVNGIKGLAVPHIWIDAAPIDPERFEDKWRDTVREPGDPPLEVHHQVQNWWVWCKPGDVIVLDECQRVFRPMASGRRLPMYIEKLETARHYGVQFLYITQRPNLIHNNLRGLIGPHQHVARMLGGMRTVIYEWAECTNTDKKAAATKRFWKHDKTAFGLYESSQLHTKFSQRWPAAVWALIFGAIGMAALAFIMKDRMVSRFSPPAAGQSTPGTTGPAGGPPRPAQTRAAGTAGGQAVLHTTALAVSPAPATREPYAGFGLHLVGSVSINDQATWSFSVSRNGQVLQILRDADLHRAGYAWRSIGPCMGLLAFGTQERLVTCDNPATAPAAGARQPATAASAPF